MPGTKLDQLYIKKLLQDLRGSRFPWFQKFLRGRYYFTREETLAILKLMTGQDFGYDVKAWRKWFDENPDTKLKH
jgi:hypothetical protein